MSKASTYKTVLIFEPLHAGHHLKYVAIIAEAFNKKGYHVVFASYPETFTSTQYNLLLRSNEHIFEALEIPGVRLSRSTILRSIQEWWNIAKLLRKTEVDMLFFPHIDSSFYAFGLFGPIVLSVLCRKKPDKIEGILFQGDYAYDQLPYTILRRFKYFLARFIVRWGPYTRILVLDIFAYDCLKHEEAKHTTPLVFCPECVEKPGKTNSSEFRRALAIPSEAQVLGAFGVLDERKGVDLLINAFRNYAPRDGDYLLLMGSQSPGVRHLLNGSEPLKNIVAVDRFVTDEELVTSINACDVVAVTYPQHVGSSHILIRAAAANKPVLATNFGAISYFTNKYNLGYCCDVLDARELLKGMEWAFDKPVCNRQAADEFWSLNTIERFERVVTNGV
jgi:glycosyltransferase involved in cell wall biosynthesis